MSFAPTAVETIPALLAQANDRTIGAALAPDDVSQLLLSCQIGILNASHGVWDSPSSSLGWDSIGWNDAAYISWVDLTARVRALVWDRGAADPLQQPEVGTATVTLANLDGLISPWATSGAFTNPVDNQPVWDSTAWDFEVPGSAASLIRPGTPVRFGVTTSTGVWDPFFTGFIETVTEKTSDHTDAWVELGLVDVLSVPAAIDQSNGTTGGGALVAGNTALQIVLGLLADIDPHNTLALTTLVPNTDAYLNSAPLDVPDDALNRLQALQLAVASGNAYLIGGPDGSIYVTSRAVTDPLFVTFTNNPTAGLVNPEYGLVDATPYSSTDRLLNSAMAAGVTGNPLTVTDPNSIAAFGVRANALGYPRTDLLLQNDGDVTALLTSVVSQQSNDYLGISEISIDADLAIPAAGSTTAIYSLLTYIANRGIENGSQFPVRWKHPSGSILTVTVRLIGFSQSITMEGGRVKWTATYRTIKA